MRKADYATLARIIAHDCEELSRAENETNDPRLAMAAACARTALQNVARVFSKTASVNRTEFLKACGIDP